MFGFEKPGKGPSKEDKAEINAILADSPENIIQALEPEHLTEAKKFLTLPGVTAETIRKELARLTEVQKETDSEDVRNAIALLNNSIQ